MNAPASGFGGVFDGGSAGWRTPLRAWGPLAGCSDTASHGVAWHGDIFNSADLAAQLGLPASTPLADVLIAGLQRWGDALPGKLHGIFALLLRQGGRLLLARDASGLRNLQCFTGRPGQLAVASDLHTLLALPGSTRRVDRRSLHEYLRFLDIAAPNCWFADVTAVEAGQTLHWSGQALRALPAVPADAAGSAAPAHFDDAVQQLDLLLQRAVQRPLATAARPAAFLSGGVDSSLLCALAGRMRPDTTAVTVGFDGGSFDETPVAARIAAHLGLRHEVLRFSHHDHAGALQRYSRHAEQPMADPAVLSTLLAFDHCSGRFDAVLDGTGADEAVGMLPPRHVRLAVAQASRLPAALRRAITTGVRAVPPLAGYAPIVDFEHPADTMIRWHGFTRPEVQALCGEPVSFEHTQFYKTFARFPRQAHFERYSALINAMPCERLNQGWLISGLPLAFPFFDADADRFIRQLRTEHRYLPGQPKRILRALLARYAPQPLWDQPKHGFDFPLRAFLAADDFALVRRQLDAPRWTAQGLLDGRQVAQLAQRFMAGDQRLLFRVWALVVLGNWLEQQQCA